MKPRYLKTIPFILSFLYIAGTSYAEDWVCPDASYIKSANTASGCTAVPESSVPAQRDIADKVLQKYRKVVSNLLVEKTTQEKADQDAADAAVAQAAIEAEEASEPLLKELRDQADAGISAIDTYLVGADTATNAQVRAEVKAMDIRQKKIIQALKRIIEREWRPAP